MNEKDPIKELIEKSGNTLHYKVVEFLRKVGWIVLVSPYYTDGISDKPREIDIIAEKYFEVRDDGAFGQWKGTVNVKLFIECKYVAKSIVFWFDNKNMEEAVNRICKDTPLEPPKKNIYIEKHHYFTERKVAKLFASSSDKLPDNEIIYKAINQSLNAMVYYKDSGSMNSTNSPGNRNILHMINYPLILCNNFDNIFEVENTDTAKYMKINNNFQLEACIQPVSATREELKTSAGVLNPRHFLGR